MTSANVCESISDPYELLGVSRNASREEIRRAFQEKARKFHPDKHVTGMSHSERESCSDMFCKLSHAYHMLTDDDTRHQHDVQVRAQEMTENLIINDTVCLADMTIEGTMYTLNCRCGGSYVVDSEQDCNKREHLVIPCDSCSLHVKIIIN